MLTSAVPLSTLPSKPQPVLTNVLCNYCRGKFTVDDLKVHMPTCQGMPPEQSQKQHGKCEKSLDSENITLHHFETGEKNTQNDKSETIISTLLSDQQNEISSYHIS